MALETRPEQLPCGRDPLLLIDSARLGRIEEHSRHCPHCQDAISQDLLAQRIIADLRAVPVEVPTSLLPAVMNTVWSELRPGRRIPLPIPGENAFATELAITSMLQRALEQLPDLLVHLCRLHLSDNPSDDQDATAQHQTNTPTDEATPDLRVEVRAAAAYPVDLSALASSTRELAAATLLTQFGLTPTSIDVHFVDVYQSQGA